MLYNQRKDLISCSIFIIVDFDICTDPSYCKAILGSYMRRHSMIGWRLRGKSDIFTVGMNCRTVSLLSIAGDKMNLVANLSLHPSDSTWVECVNWGTLVLQLEDASALASRRLMFRALSSSHSSSPSDRRDSEI